MSDGSLEARILESLKDAQTRIDAIQSSAAEEIGDLEGRYRQYEALVEALKENDQARPLSTLAGMFDNATAEGSRVGSSFIGKVTFLHTPRYPSTVTVKLTLGHDAEIRNVTLTFEFEMLPLFISCERHHTLSLPLDTATPEELVTWANDRVVAFVKVYSSLQYVDQYQQENLVSDPVVDARFSKLHAAAQEEYQGRTYYFLTEESHSLFLEDPTRFVVG